MLTIRAEIKRNEQKVDGTFNVKLRFTLDRKVKRLSTSLFAHSCDITKSGNFKKGTTLQKEIDKLIMAYQSKCAEMQIELNHYTLDYIFQKLQFDERKSQEIDFIRFSKEWISTTSIKGVCNYATASNSLTSYTKKEHLYISEFTRSFLTKYVEYLNKCREDKIQKLILKGKRVPSNRMLSLYLGSLRHLFKEAQKAYNDYDNGFILIPYSPFDNFKIPKQEATRKRAIQPATIKRMLELPYKNRKKGQKSTCRYDLAKDCFILSFCLIGMNSADLFNATELTEKSITYYRTKTTARRLDAAKMVVNIPDIVLPLIEKYRDRTGRRIFCFYKYYCDHKTFNKAINCGLKEIGAELDIDDLEFYAARHSWATIALNKVGIDKYTVHAALNHVDESMRVTDIYIERDFVNENKANAKVIEYVFGQ